MKKILALMLAVLMMATCAMAFSGCKKENANVKVIDIALTDEEYAFAVQKGNTELLAELNAFLAEIKANGKFEEIINKYFGNGTPTAVTSAADKNDGTQLIVATNAEFAPFEYMEGENYYGVDMELMKMFAEKLGKELVIHNMNFDAVCLAVSTTGGDYNGENGEVVKSGTCDIAAAGLTVSEDRKNILDFSDSYYKASQMLIVAETNTVFDNCKSAADVEAILNTYTDSTKVGVQTGTTGELYCKGDEEWDFAGFGFTTVGYTSGALAVQDIINGNVSFVVIDEGPAKAIVQNVNAAN